MCVLVCACFFHIESIEIVFKEKNKEKKRNYQLNTVATCNYTTMYFIHFWFVSNTKTNKFYKNSTSLIHAFVGQKPLCFVVVLLHLWLNNINFALLLSCSLALSVYPSMHYLLFIFNSMAFAGLHSSYFPLQIKISCCSTINWILFFISLVSYSMFGMVWFCHWHKQSHTHTCMHIAHKHSYFNAIDSIWGGWNKINFIWLLFL